MISLFEIIATAIAIFLSKGKNIKARQRISDKITGKMRLIKVFLLLKKIEGKRYIAMELDYLGKSTAVRMYTLLHAV